METQTSETELGGEISLQIPLSPTLFKGRGEYGIDDKGRLTLPSHMRKPLADGGSLAVLDERAVIWPDEVFDRAVAHLHELVATQDLTRQHVRGFISNAHPVSPDTQGRIVVPPAVRIEAGLDGPILILGAGSRIELLPASSEGLEELFGIDESIVDALDRANF
ncbi:MAG: hypothetical protein U5K30_01140 [Acidimicrobiales bacterium]|nr:hypothetical protein [Acidimicrobiales bacterium]